MTESCKKACSNGTHEVAICNNFHKDTTVAPSDPEHPLNLIPLLLRRFYKLGWCSGTGGGISIRQGDEIYIAPSSVQKEFIKAEDMFVVRLDGSIISSPKTPVKQSQCTPMFMATYQLAGSGACVHSHSKHAVLATLLFEKEFRVSHLEMIKGIRRSRSGTYYRFDEELVVPIIENTPFEKDLETSFRECMERCPEASCVLVRRHGFYCWGPTWQQAKAMSECFDYLFEMAVEMRRLGLPTVHSISDSSQ